jgi:hypothetical protein
LKDFVYTFSTGPALDSLTLDGRVILAETGEIDSTLIAVLHRDLTDSAVYRNRPKYAVRLDRNGRFHFKNLPADTFALYVIGDAGLSKKYMNPNQLFAFPDKPVIAGKTDSLLIYAYREEEKKSAPPPSAAFKPGGNDRRLRFATAPPSQQDLLENYELSFSVPLRNIDSSKIQLTTDSIFAPVRYSLSLDSTRKKIELRSQWKENTRYNLVLDKDFATDTTGRQLLKSDTVFFTTKKAAEYGNLALKIRNVDSTLNPVLLFVQNGKVVKSVSIRSGSFQQVLFPPGEYALRVLYDRNNNGKWDPGQFFKVRRQPEIVKTISQTIVVKPNWENEFDVVL